MSETLVDKKPVLFTEKPFVFAVSGPEWSRVCAFCMASYQATEKSSLEPICGDDSVRIRLLRCLECCQVKYCSRECQQKDWESGQHKRECTVFKKFTNDPAVMQLYRDFVEVRLIARLLARLANGGETVLSGEFIQAADYEAKKFRNFSLGHRIFADLESEVSDDKIRDFVDDQNWWKAEWSKFQEIYGLRSTFYHKIGEKRFRRALKVVRRFQMPVIRYDVLKVPAVVGKAVFVECSRFGHSCVRPDLRIFTEGSQMNVKISTELENNLENMENLSLDNLKISLFDSVTLSPNVLSVKERQEMLKNRFLQCSCSMCNDDITDGKKFYGVKSKCAACGGTLVINPTQEESLACCGSCQCLVSIPKTIFHMVRRIFRQTESSVATENAISVEGPLELWQRAEGVMDQGNVLLLRLREMCAFYLMKQIDEEPGLVTPLLFFLRRILETLAKMEDVSSYHALFLVAAANLEIFTNDHQEGLRHCEAAKEIWMELCGSSHHCIRQLDQIMISIEQKKLND